jgi:hypothetical protein
MVAQRGFAANKWAGADVLLDLDFFSARDDFERPKT